MVTVVHLAYLSEWSTLDGGVYLGQISAMVLGLRVWRL
jgi:hypothetical protein